MALDNPLWRYALALYARPGVEQCALRLQDQGAVVNWLLLACWLGQRQVPLTAARCAVAEDDWQAGVVSPLRHLRLQLRARRQERPEVEACYRHLKQAELAAEQIELMQLWQASRSWPAEPGTEGAAQVRANLDRYARWRALSLSPVDLETLSAAAAGLSPPAAELSSGGTY
ncbi:TIGR02444 family protein [Marinobacterium weihaiense]|uniref:TIGR02444 family protein n=1 Tax=Marinobacterium weihaiense TaxID=2851016 RepID=A0ABS6MDX8_9GAMM|nr:TIGR02444 family protein [Marinobacterium weihaiense]MBV0933947.1 TIGR02444 family protein [Marinobacterium weihaiense]